MPYVNKEYRDILDDYVNELIITLKMLKDDSLDGCLNYVVTLLIDKLYGNNGYAVHNRAIGILECVKQEYYRRKIVPYEEKKRKDNGDVYV